MGQQHQREGRKKEHKNRNCTDCPTIEGSGAQNCHPTRQDNRERQRDQNPPHQNKNPRKEERRKRTQINTDYQHTPTHTI